MTSAIRVCCSVKEREFLEDVILASGKTKTAWLKAALLAALGGQIIKHYPRETTTPRDESATLEVRVTATQQADAWRIAEEWGGTIGEWFRCAALGQIERQQKRAVLKSQLKLPNLT